MENAIHNDGRELLSSPLDDASFMTEALFDLTMSKDFDDDELADMHERFLRSGYVRMPNFLTPTALRFLRYELRRLELDASRRVFEMPGYHSPRNLSVVGGTIIKARSPFLFRLYQHSALRECVASIVGRPIYSCAHPEEFMVANFLQCNGDTHGWHMDDPAFALVVFVDAPAEGEGGQVEMIPNWVSFCSRRGRKPDSDIGDLVQWASENGMVERHHHDAGDAYLLRADRNLHRVTPLVSSNSRRSVINCAFQVTPDTSYASTADLLYGHHGGANA
jgi:hypothetical protein